jgi:glycosyltransferase involved in cell wall biosynthesis
MKGGASLHIFGDGPDRAHVERMVGELGLGARVSLHGMVPRPEDALGRIDVLAMASEAEGFPMVLIEAMAAGVPIVATDAPGIRDVVQDGRTALMAPVGEPARLAAALDRLGGDAGLRERLIAAGRRVVAERFTWDIVMAQYCQVLGIAEEAGQANANTR